MGPWWDAWPGRLEAEIDAFRDLGFTFEPDQGEKAAGRLILCGTYRLRSGREIALKVVYPDTFPNTRFTVYAPNAQDRLSLHQNPLGGNLCLLPRGSRWWRPSLLAADVVSDRIELLYADAGVPADLEDEQGEPVTSYLAFANRGGIVVPEESFDIPAGATGGRFRLALSNAEWLPAEFDNTDGPLGCALLVEVLGANGETLRRADDRLRPHFAGQTIVGAWERLTEKPDPCSIEQLEKRFESLFSKFEFRKWPQIGQWRWAAGGFLLPEEAQYHVDRNTWLFRLVAQRQRSSLARAGYVRTLRYGTDTRSARVPELAALKGRSASLVGLGSLGAPLALEFARAGLGELRVADFDHADPAGGVRWISDLAFAGARKTRAVADAVRRDFPFTSVRSFDVMVGDAPLARGADAEGETLRRWASGAGLLVDATAEENVSRVVAAVGATEGVPQLYLWSIDAYGGVVARVVPGRTGCLHCLALATSPERGGEIGPLPFAADSDQRRIQPTGCSDPTFQGDSASLMPLVDHAARVAYGILCEGVKGAYPSYEHDVFILKLREPDGRLVTPQWSSFPLRIHPECPLCKPNSSSPSST